jgi:two-component system, LytTR family, response regulator
LYKKRDKSMNPSMNNLMKTVIRPVIKDDFVLFVATNALKYINCDEIMYMQADDCYTILCFRDQSRHVMNKNLKEYETELDDRRFFRCHKSFIVNKSFITGKYSTSESYLQMQNGIRVPVARHRIAKLKHFLKKG